MMEGARVPVNIRAREPVFGTEIYFMVVSVSKRAPLEIKRNFAIDPIFQKRQVGTHISKGVDMN